MISLDKTIDEMQSADYKERFWAEYWQTKIRYEKLRHMLVKYEAGTLPFKPSCPIERLRDQLYYMANYLESLEIRAEIEKVYIGENRPGKGSNE